MKTENQGWSKELIEKSIDVLFNGRCMEPCHVKHLDHSYGTVSVIQGICKNKWDVVRKDGRVEHYTDVEDLVNAGWVVD